MSKALQKRPSLSKKRKQVPKIIIDEAKGLVFSTEQELYAHFQREIDQLEKEFFSRRHSEDVTEGEMSQFETNLTTLLEDPDEVWEDHRTIQGQNLVIYLRRMNEEDETPLFHIAICYLADDTPSFVYLHFPTRDVNLVHAYQRFEKIYDRALTQIPIGAQEGDALTEADELAVGLYTAMMKLRSDKDIPENEFPDYFEFREAALESADEIWRSSDSLGNTLVSFVKEYEDDNGQHFYYVVVTVEDEASNSHALLFAFPTQDAMLIERYRHGENLQAEEVVQEASH